MRRVLTLLTAAAAGLAMAASAGTANASPAPATSTTSIPLAVKVCSQAPVGYAGCLSWLNTHASHKAGTASANAVSPDATPSGYGPSDLQSAYALATASADNGAGVTVGIVDAYNDPNAFSDVNVYRSQYGETDLASCTPTAVKSSTTPCFAKSSQTGTTSYPSTDGGWAEEESLDIDMVSAICPNCNILLVEATSSSYANLGTAVNEAVKLGATAVSNSYGGSDSSSDSSYDSSYYKHSGVAITASSGDGGYGVEYPAASQYVTAVGGTSLSTASNTRGWTETAWSDAGSGCSAYETKPSWQTDTGCTKRTVADVSAVADPNTGVAVYDSTSYEGYVGWLEFGGTSVSSPIIASVYAIAGNDTTVTYGSYPYAHSSSLYDVTSGSNGTCSPSYLCTAGTGYDGPTGLGTPDGTGAF